MNYPHLKIKTRPLFCPVIKAEIYSEGHLERFILQRWGDIFPFNHEGTRKKISKRSIPDFIGGNENGCYIIELKHRPIRESDSRQIWKYRKDASLVDNLLGVFIVGYDNWKQEISIYAV